MSLAALESQAAEAKARLPRTTFTIPEEERSATDPKTVTLRQLTSSEDETALIVSSRKGLPYEYEGAKRSFCAADGNELTWENDQVETVYLGLSTKVRELVMHGFRLVSMPKKASIDAFLESAKTT